MQGLARFPSTAVSQLSVAAWAEPMISPRSSTSAPKKKLSGLFCMGLRVCKVKGFSVSAEGCVGWSTIFGWAVQDIISSVGTACLRRIIPSSLSGTPDPAHSFLTTIQGTGQTRKAHMHTYRTLVLRVPVIPNQSNVAPCFFRAPSLMSRLGDSSGQGI